MAAGNLRLFHLAIQASQLKMCVCQIGRKIVVKNLPAATENLLPVSSGKTPMSLRLIGTGETSMRENSRIFLNRISERAFCLYRSRISKPDLPFQVVKTALV